MNVTAAGFLAAHGLHAAMLLVPSAGFAVVALAADVRAWWRRGSRASRLGPTQGCPPAGAATKDEAR